MHRLRAIIAATLVTALVLPASALAAISSRIYDVTFVDPSRGYMSGVWYDGDTPTGFISTTSNGGASWGARQLFGHAVIGIDALNASSAWGVGYYQTRPLKTVNGGVLWSSSGGALSGPQALPRDVAHLSADTALVVGKHTDAVNGELATVWRTSSAGATWTKVNEWFRYPPDSDGYVPYAYAQYNAVDGAPSGAVAYAVGYENRPDDQLVFKQALIAKTTDSGASWANVTPPVGTPALTDVVATDDTVGWAVGVSGTISRALRTTNSGSSWSLAPVNPPVQYAEAIHATSSTHAIVVGSAGKVARTIDGGASWKTWQSPTIANRVALQSVAMLDETHAIAVGDEQLIVRLTLNPDGTMTGTEARAVNGTLNTPPVATNDTFNATSGTSLAVPKPGVLANDTDANGDALTAHLLANASHGTLVLSSDGGFSYTPNPGFVGTDTFTYRAYDGIAYSSAATVSIVVAGQPSTVDFQHDAAGVTFDRWVTGYSTAYSGGGYVYGRWAGTRLDAKFTGSKIHWVGPKQPSYGMADVYIDDVLVASGVDCYAPAGQATLSTKIWESGTLTDGAHTLSIRLTGTKNPASTGNVVVLDRFEVTGAAPTGGGTRYDERDGTMSGSWLSYANPTYFDKTYSYSRWTNATFSLTFDGTKVAWIGPRTANYGMADVYIDGVKVATVDQYRANLATQGWREVVWESGTLSSGTHTLEIKPLGTKHADALGYNVIIDAFDVMR